MEVVARDENRGLRQAGARHLGREEAQPADSTLDRASVDAVINELDEYAIEEALQIAEANGGEVVVLSMGPDRTTESIRKALSMGAARGVHVVDDALHGACASGTSKALAKAIEAEAPDLVIFGSESTDARMSVVPAMVAERLGYPQLTFANNVTVDGGTVTIKRQTEAGVDVVAGATPRWCRWSRRSTSPATPTSRGSWPPRRSRSTPSRWPTWASTAPA